MSGQQHVLDPRLGSSSAAAYATPASSHAHPHPHPHPHPHTHPHTHTHTQYASQRSDSLKLEGSGGGANYRSPPQPYYYPSPQTTHTPQQSGAHSDAHSTQQSPGGAYASGGGGGAESAGSPDAEGEGANGGGADDAKRPRACEACRGLKVRCDQDPAHPEIPCKRCAKAGRQCVITQPSRKRQKKADTRVAELEKKLDALTAALQQQQGGGGVPYTTPPHALPPAEMMGGRVSSANMSHPYPTPQFPPARAASADPEVPASKRRRIDGAPEETPSYDGADAINEHPLSRVGSLQMDSMPAQTNSLADPAAPDLHRCLYHQSPEEFISRINSLINPDMASTIFNRYITKLAPHLPAVVFPPGTTAEHVFKEKPILYVCILSAASHGTLHPDISKQIAKEAVGAIADCVVRNGAKSLELIQAMQVTALWYRPPEKAEQTNFYQIIHMAAVMALDIGLGKRFNPSKARRGFGGPNAHYAPGPHKTLPQDSDTLEARRAWLGCYYLCAGASMILRRANLVRWTNYMKECIEVLESHPDAYPSDKLFCQHIKIQHICEDIGLQFLMDDNTANISITDPKVSYALHVLENQLKDWKEKIPPECRTPSLQFFEHVTALYLHEIALHFNHNVEDFRLPFTEESLKSVNSTSDTLTQNQMAALEACLQAAHGILDAMLAFDIQTVKTLPMLIYFVRCTYAIVILIKMHVAVCTPHSELGKMMKPGDLKVEFYVDRLIALFGYVAKEEEFRPHPKILRILNLLRDWFGKHKEAVLAQQGQGVGLVVGEGKEVAVQQQQQQTPLHLLSQVATGGEQRPHPPRSGSATTTTSTEAQHPQQQAQQQQQAHQQQQSQQQQQQDWTFPSPVVFDFHLSKQAQQQQQARALPSTTAATAYPAGVYAPDAAYPPPGLSEPPGSILDPNNPEFGWGTNFEQAMDMALGGFDGLAAGGLDGWFLGDSMAPFGIGPGPGNVPGSTGFGVGGGGAEAGTGGW